MSENTQEALTKAEKKIKISARVYRAATGEWEDIGVVAEEDGTISKPKLKEFIGKLEDAGADKSILEQLRGVYNKLKG